MQKVSVRYATSMDLAQLKKLGRDAWPEWWRENPGFGIKYVKERIDGRRTIVAVANDMRYGSLWSRHMHLEDVYIKQGYRRMGIGSALMERLIQIAKKNSIRKIVGEEESGNKIAYNYNIKHGFKEVGYVKRLWGNSDAIVFIKEIR